MKTIITAASAIAVATSSAASMRSDSPREILSPNLLARIWVSKDFKKQFTENPHLWIDETEPGGNTYKVLFNSETVKHLVLSLDEHDARRLGGWGDLDTDNSTLPETPDAHWTTLLQKHKDKEISTRQLATILKETLKLRGVALKLVENTSHAKYIVIPSSPIDYSVMDVIEERVALGGNTTKCCSSGTCDIVSNRAGHGCGSCHAPKPMNKDWPQQLSAQPAETRKAPMEEK